MIQSQTNRESLKENYRNADYYLYICIIQNQTFRFFFHMNFFLHENILKYKTVHINDIYKRAIYTSLNGVENQERTSRYTLYDLSYLMRSHNGIAQADLAAAEPEHGIHRLYLQYHEFPLHF